MLPCISFASLPPSAALPRLHTACSMTRRPPPAARPPVGFRIGGHGPRPRGLAPPLILPRFHPLRPPGLPPRLLPSAVVLRRPHPYPPASGRRQYKARVRPRRRAVCRLLRCPHLPGSLCMASLACGCYPRPGLIWQHLLDRHEQGPL
ncbi:hypothetical protein PVAP13_2NG067200 [Panicum virgatum]|uniref:Uncharacterized protein n=1 Tax=Panicum virgatum TaxID=38727 RepID=A0A8T0VAD1_PANVG|nr:hypothetical protein PVAP13_2NG067200 [Panicum virgatum]